MFSLVASSLVFFFRMLPSFFPPSLDRAKELKLERCIRMLPQDQDSGGFFVAVLVKTGPILWQVCFVLFCFFAFVLVVSPCPAGSKQEQLKACNTSRIDIDRMHVQGQQQQQH